MTDATSQTMTILEDLRTGRLVVVPPVGVKPLEWQSSAWNHRSADIYVIEDMGVNWSHDRFWLAAHGILDNVGLGEFGTLDAAKAAAQADYEARILSALAASPDHTAGLIALVEGMGEKNEALLALREKDCADYVKMAKNAIDNLARALAAEAERDALREALAPFANYYGPHYPDTDDKGKPLPDEDGVGWVYLTVGDFRRARALTKEQADGE